MMTLTTRRKNQQGNCDNRNRQRVAREVDARGVACSPSDNDRLDILGQAALDLEDSEDGHSATTPRSVSHPVREPVIRSETHEIKKMILRPNSSDAGAKIKGPCCAHSRRQLCALDTGNDTGSQDSLRRATRDLSAPVETRRESELRLTSEQERRDREGADNSANPELGSNDLSRRRWSRRRKGHAEGQKL